jgi:hypothetical protein
MTPRISSMPSSKGLHNPAVMIVAALLSGVAVGVGTQLLQGVLPEAWGVLANSGVIWALAAFALGTTLRSFPVAMIGGALQLVAASAMYSLAVDWFEGGSFSVRGAVIWSIAGTCCGIVFGAAGHGFARSSATRPGGVAVVAGTMFVEGAYLTWHVGNATLRPAGLVELVVAGGLAGWALVEQARHDPSNSLWHVFAALATSIVATVAAGVVIQRSFALW